jgi:hypothetical protein
MTQLPYMDTQCGFKAFKGPIAKLLFHGSHVERFAFDVEVLDMAARLGLRTEQVPVRWTDIAGSHVRPIRDGMKMLGDLARVRLMRKFQPPVQGVLMPDVPIEAADALIQPRIRNVDLVIEWEGGTAVLFPCLPPSAIGGVSSRLLSEFEAHDPEELSIEFGALFAPVLAADVRIENFRCQETPAIDLVVPGVATRAS